MNKDKEKIVVIARFTYPANAHVLVSLLQEAGIECYLRNEFSAQILGGYVDIGGAALEVLEGDAERAIEIAKESGYERFLNI
jgi:hypothetical protein